MSESQDNDDTGSSDTGEEESLDDIKPQDPPTSPTPETGTKPLSWEMYFDEPTFRDTTGPQTAIRLGDRWLHRLSAFSEVEPTLTLVDRETEQTVGSASVKGVSLLPIHLVPNQWFRLHHTGRDEPGVLDLFVDMYGNRLPEDLNEAVVTTVVFKLKHLEDEYC